MKFLPAPTLCGERLTLPVLKSRIWLRFLRVVAKGKKETKEMPCTVPSVGGVMADGAAFCANCGQAFAVAAAVARAHDDEFAGCGTDCGRCGGRSRVRRICRRPARGVRGVLVRFWRSSSTTRVMGIGFVLILIPLIFLTGWADSSARSIPNEDMNDVGIFMLFGLLFLAATVSLLLTWLYHALMESSEWQATLGKKVLGLVVTDMAGRRVSFGRATGRHFAKIITQHVPAFIGYIMAGFTERKQALHDMIAGCLVLRRNN